MIRMSFVQIIVLKTPAYTYMQNKVGDVYCKLCAQADSIDGKKVELWEVSGYVKIAASKCLRRINTLCAWKWCMCVAAVAFGF